MRHAEGGTLSHATPRAETPPAALPKPRYQLGRSVALLASYPLNL
jgi:hypothetical protein